MLIWIFSVSGVCVFCLYFSCYLCNWDWLSTIKFGVCILFNLIEGGGKSLLFQSSTATISKFTEKSYTSQKVLFFFIIVLRKRIGPFFLVFQIYSWFLFFYQNYALFRSIGFATKLKSTSAILMNVIKIKKT